jgi:hypothetical protein
MNIEFFRQILGKSSNIKFMKICPVGAELFYADGRTDGQKDEQTDRLTDMTKLIIAFRNFANATKNILIFRLTNK